LALSVTISLLHRSPVLCLFATYKVTVIFQIYGALLNFSCRTCDYNFPDFLLLIHLCYIIHAMYKTFYGFKENAFNITSDPAFYFESSQHKEAYAHLLYGIRNRKGIISMTGEVGTGKTTLCRILLNQIDEKIKTAFIFNPSFSQIQLLQMITKDLGIPQPKKNNDKLALMSALNQFLIDETAQGHNVAVIIDEAQNLNTVQLEQIRLLSNLETEKEKLLQIILVGQPELLEKLKKKSLRQLNSRISVRYHIQPLERDDVGQYITHRLNIAGAPIELNFTASAIDDIYNFTKGTPRLINILCEHTLLAGFVNETMTINNTLVRTAAKEALG
ncbi:MAG: AAA family ATPase, partial [Candidatus Omnitrophota bacterium]